MSIVGGYVLDLYCDYQNPDHVYLEFPWQYVTEFGWTCRAEARRDGWQLDLRKGLARCPKCVRAGIMLLKESDG